MLRFRSGEDDLFRQNMFKVPFLSISRSRLNFLQMLCGTEPHPKDFKAKKYKLEKHSLSKEEFVHIMKNLPVLQRTNDLINIK